MKILFVCDQFDAANNGTTITARRFFYHLAGRGHEMRVVATGDEAEDKYVVKEFKLPLGDSIIKSQGMMFARPDSKTLEEAISWADVVHFVMPFALSIEGEKICRRLGVPCTAAFHVQPENITSTVHLKDFTPINTLIYHGFRDIFFNKFKHIHCPSRFIAGELEKNGYSAKLHVISNGVEPDFVYRRDKVKSPEFEGKIVILMIGRLSIEKRQDVIIDAVPLSKYADRIQLVFAGQGPTHDALVERGERLPNKPIFRFFDKEALIDMIAQTDIYVHAADIEIEAISCIEAFSCGAVPIIANSTRSATRQFALDKRSLFVPGDPKDLAETIDYWLDNPDERERMEYKYAEHGKQYNIERSIDLAEQMFEEAIRDFNEKN